MTYPADVVKNSSVACFADDTKIFRRVDSICDADLLQTDLSNLDSWSTSSGLVFNQLKCKCLRVTRKTQPVIYPYTIKDNELTTTSAEKDLGIWVSSDLTWTKHVLERCTKAKKLLGFVRRSGREITNTRTRRTLYLSVVRPVPCLCKSGMVAPVHRSHQTNRTYPEKSFQVHTESSLHV